jgi:hypothetical protein
MSKCVIYSFILDSSVGIATGYRLNGRGSVPGRTKDVSLLHSVQTRSGAHQASYPVSTGALSPEEERPGREVDHSPPSSVEIKNDGAIPPLPHASS